jgi:hypothetical protein
MSVIRFLFALLLGFVLGAGVATYFFSSGAGDLLIRRTEAVQDMERRLHDVETQRDTLTRQLEDVVARSARTEQAFNELERRFRDLERGPDNPGARQPDAPQH